MEETNQTYADEEGDETIVAPRFDDEETVLARRVVPLEDVDAAHADAHDSTPSTAPTQHASSLRAKPRRSLVAVLVLVSALVGSVLGVGGLYLYQKQRNAATEPATEQKAETTAPVAQPTSEAETENHATEQKAAEPTPSTPAAPETSAHGEEAKADSAKDTKDKGSKEVDDKSAAERRNNSEEREAVATPKRGKKGTRDEETQREERRARRDDDESARGDDDVPDRREARRVGVITYRQRRVSPRRGPYADADRLRRIFEGQP